MAQFAENTRIRHLEDALANLDIAAKRAKEIRSRLGYLIDPLVDRRIDELLEALATAQQYVSAERQRKE